MINIYDTANQMEQDLRKTEQYQDLERAYTELKSDEEAFECFKSIHSLTDELQKKQMSGQQVTEDDVRKLQDLGKKADGYEKLQMLMQKEQALNMMMDELSKIIFRPFREIYKD